MCFYRFIFVITTLKNDINPLFSQNGLEKMFELHLNFIKKKIRLLNESGTGFFFFFNFETVGFVAYLNANRRRTVCPVGGVFDAQRFVRIVV